MADNVKNYAELTDNEKLFITLYEQASDDLKSIIKYMLCLDKDGWNNLLNETGIDLNTKEHTQEEFKRIIDYVNKKQNTEQLSLSEVQGLLNVSYKTALGYIQTGKLPAHRVGGKWKINKADFEAFAYGK